MIETGVIEDPSPRRAREWEHAATEVRPEPNMSWLAPHAELECCDIVTTGRRSGRPHEVEMWFGVMDGALYLISGNGPTADWYQNLLAHPAVTVRLGGEERVGRASPVTDIEERHRCGDLMGAKYVWEGDPDIGLTYEAWCYDVPAIAIDFDDPATA